MKKVLIFGKGYVAKHFYSMFQNEFEIKFVSRHPEQKDIDFNKLEEIEQGLNWAEHVLITTPAVNGSDPVLEKIPNKINKLRSVTYLSSTSVYGDHAGQWVDEESALKCQPESLGASRVRAEKMAKEFAKKSQAKCFILRLSGIYGPSRNVVEKFRQGEEVQNIYAPHHFFSRIHVEDIISIIAKIINSNPEEGAYNLADDAPSPRHEIIEHAAMLCGVKAPPRIAIQDANLSEMGKKFYQENKKVSNAKLKKNLSYDFTFPSFEVGNASFFSD